MSVASIISALVVAATVIGTVIGVLVWPAFPDVVELAEEGRGR